MDGGIIEILMKKKFLELINLTFKKRRQNNHCHYANTNADTNCKHFSFLTSCHMDKLTH